MKLTLERPLVFIDIEATGLNTQEDRIIELAVLKLFPDGTKDVKCKRYNPGMPIPAASTEVHGIKDEDVKDCPPFYKQAKGILEFIDGCDIAGFNSNFYDVPILYFELLRAGLIWEYKKCRLIDVGNIYKINEQRTLEAAVKFYLNKEHKDAHSAEADVLATAEVFIAQLDKYTDLPKDINELSLYSNYGKRIVDMAGRFVMDDNGNILLNFGKYKGEKAEDHIDFLEWMVNRANFPEDTNTVANQIIHKAYYGEERTITD